MNKWPTFRIGSVSLSNVGITDSGGSLLSQEAILLSICFRFLKMKLRKLLTTLFILPNHVLRRIYNKNYTYTVVCVPIENNLIHSISFEAISIYREEHTII